MTKCEPGLRRALEIVDKLIERRCEPRPRSNTWSDGWKLGMEEVRYKLNMELDFQQFIKEEEER